MTEITLRYDHNTENIINEMRHFWGFKNEAQVIEKALASLRFLMAVKSTNGEIIARREGAETKYNF
jgi:hypothetical protein